MSGFGAHAAAGLGAFLLPAEAALTGISTGALEGNFRLNGDLVSSGNFSPGAAGIAGTIEVRGNVFLLPQGTFNADIGPEGKPSDLLEVGMVEEDPSTGQVLLSGQLRLRLQPGFHEAPRSSITLINAPGGVAGAFANAADGTRLFADDGLTSWLVSITPAGVHLSQCETHFRILHAPRPPSSPAPVWLEWASTATRFEVQRSTDLDNWETLLTTRYRIASVPTLPGRCWFRVREAGGAGQ